MIAADQAAPPTHVPAVGHGARRRGRDFRWRLAIVVFSGLLVVTAFSMKDRPDERPNGPPPIAGAVIVTPWLITGGQPTDEDIIGLRDIYGVTAIVDLRVADGREAAVAEEFGLDFLQLPMQQGHACGPKDLERLVIFIRSHAAGVVYLHDDTGGDRAVTATAMLLLLEEFETAGDPLLAIPNRRLSPRQRTALANLSDAVIGRHLGGNPYRAVARRLS